MTTENSQEVTKDTEVESQAAGKQTTDNQDGSPVKGKEASSQSDSSTLLGKKPDEEVEGKGKEGEEGKDKSVEGKDYEKFTVPEGLVLDEALLGEVAPIFKEAGLSQAVAQKLVDKYAAHVQAQTSSMQEKQVKAWTDQLTEWKEETKKDHGAGLKDAISYASRAIDKFGTPRLREVLDQTGLGNHPELVRILSRIGKAISEDSFIDPGTNTPNAKEGIDTSRLYNHPSQKS
jgi:hypothetical protein